MLKNIFLFLVIINSVYIKAQLNLDFESMSVGSYSAVPGWTLGSSINYTSNSGYCSFYSVTNPATVSILNTPVSLGPGTPSAVPNSPLGGTKVLKFISGGMPTIGFQRLSQTLNVTQANKFFQYAYFAIVNGGDHGNCCSAHYFKINIVDCSTSPVPCSSLAVLPTTTLCINSGTLGMISTTAISLYTPSWIVKSVDLSPYIGSCITINVEPGMCTPSGHFPELYFDAVTLPALIQSTVVCNINTATLNASASNSYSWAGPGGFSSNNQSIITATAGVYTLTLGNYGCGTPSQTFNLVFINTPTITLMANNNTICLGASSTITASGAGVNTYSWNTGSTNSAVVVSPTVNTVYTVTVNAGTCPNTATIAVNVTTCTALSKNYLETNNLKIYPNPNKGSFTVQSDKGDLFFIHDQLGRVIKEVKLNANNNYTANVNGLNNGIYFISNKEITKRIIVLE